MKLRAAILASCLLACIAKGGEVEEIRDPNFPPLPSPPGADQRKLELGRMLFESKKLSGSGTHSCSSCHDLQSNGADTRPLSLGVDGAMGGANTPSVFNAALNFRQFWNGRASTLEEQISGPITNPLEMKSSWEIVLKRLQEDQILREKFKEVYQRDPSKADVENALATFERSLITPNSPFDRFLAGNDAALSEKQKRGYQKFKILGCVACHQGSNVGGNMFQTLGISGDYFKDRGGRFPSDVGRFELTKDPSDMHMFKVPSLRNVERTAPYFHDGQVPTLQKAVRLMGKYQLGRNLSEADVEEIVAFLKSLSGELPASVAPKGGK